MVLAPTNFTVWLIQSIISFQNKTRITNLRLPNSSNILCINRRLKIILKLSTLRITAIDYWTTDLKFKDISLSSFQLFSFSSPLLSIETCFSEDRGFRTEESFWLSSRCHQIQPPFFFLSSVFVSEPQWTTRLILSALRDWFSLTFLSLSCQQLSPTEMSFFECKDFATPYGFISPLKIWHVTSGSRLFSGEAVVSLMHLPPITF